MSYQALFYFLVVKPSITLFLSLGLLVVGVPAIVLVGPRHGVPCNPESRHLADKRRRGGSVFSCSMTVSGLACRMYHLTGFLSPVAV
jgi:hypothetical protein